MLKFDARLVLLILLMMPGTTNAQEWLKDRSSRAGPGIMLGDSFVFHPGLGVEGGYDTNPLRNSTDISGSGRLRITPYLDLASRSQAHRVQDEGGVDSTPPKIYLGIGIAAYYDFYFADDAAVDDQDHLGADTHINFVLFPEGVFSLATDVSYMRSLQPYESAEEHWAWHMLRPGIGFILRPGGGTLTFELGYRLRLMFFEDDLLADRNDKMGHDVRYLTSWKILPKTAVITKLTFSPILYSGSVDINNDSMPVRSSIGLQGLLTPRFGLSLFVGYGASFYGVGDDFDSFIASGELQFFITPTANVRVGGQRDFVDSYYANFFTKTGGYLKYEQMFGGLFLASLKGDVFHRGYSTMDQTTSYGTTTSTPLASERSDVWIGATLLLEVRATDWLSFHASGRYQGNITDFLYSNEYEIPDPNNPGTTTTTREEIPVDFHRFEALAGVRVHY